MNSPNIWINPHWDWAVEKGHEHTIRYVQGMTQGPQPLPEEGETLTRPFLVCAQSGLPVPVRVLRIVPIQTPTYTHLAVVVARVGDDPAASPSHSAS